MENQLQIAPQLEGAKLEAYTNLAFSKEGVLAASRSALLDAQGVALTVSESEDHKIIDDAAKKIRKIESDTKEARKEFTSLVERNFITPLVNIEKSILELTEPLAKRSLELRKAESDKATAANNLAAEKERFRVFVINDNQRRAVEYRALLDKEIDHQYLLHVEQKQAEGWPEIRTALSTLQVPLANKFNAILLTTEDMMAIYDTIDPFNAGAVLLDKQLRFDDVFSNFTRDTAPGNTGSVEIAPAPVVAVASPVVAKSVAAVGGPKIKRSYTIDTIESNEWQHAVIAAYARNYEALQPYAAKAGAGKLTVRQMADSLAKFSGEGGFNVEGLEIKTVEK